MPDLLQVVIGPLPSRRLVEPVAADLQLTELIAADLLFSEPNVIVPIGENLGFGESVNATLMSTPVVTAQVDENLRLAESVFANLIGSGTESPAPTSDQFLGNVAMPTGWNSRTQHVISSGNKQFLSQGIPIIRAPADEETVDMRSVKVNISPRIANTHQAPVNVNSQRSVNQSSSMSLRPAVVFSTPSNTPGQVGKIWGLHQSTSDSGLSYTAVPETGGWRQWKGEAHYQGGSIDGVPASASSYPYDTEATYLDCKTGTWSDPKQRAYMTGGWYRHIMDGPCSNGSPLAVSNTLFQFVHDDAHEMDRRYGPLFLTRNLYWNLFAGISYRNTGQPDNSAMTAEVTDCIFAFTRALPYPAVDQFSGDDPDTCWDDHMHGDLIKTGQSGKPPKFKFSNTVILMLGQPGQGGFATSGNTGEGYLPGGSTADSNCHFVYIDLHGDGKKLPTSAPSGKVTFAQAGFKIHYGTTLTDPAISAYVWPAIQTWIDQHPQFGFPNLASDWATNNNILNGTNGQ